ncbi:ATP-dependent DNA helicase UvrD2 [Corynebacterium pseudopelargi]|uniref:DNA 3'-5' helicase n=1 Tax=Corynebacterium pseudopelargi TaxID=2080757 RepID=A0A3G6IVH7_9CORY|nr:ATP-dependent DNA helicase UvrD2 [Corynebacterium pseudopelargi]AZA09795.1 ATP-dependent DNA helicase UvrD2 [Corynebacterium pseudopelargi]
MIDLSQLDADQRKAAEAPRGPVAILAGAGTGKTRTITYRIAHLCDQGLTSPQRVLAVTFTNRAANEMRHRLHLMGIGGVQARTFHAAAMKQLGYFWPQVAGTMPWKLLDNKFPLVARAMRSVGLDSSTEQVRDVLSEVEWAKAALVTPERYVEAASSRSTPVAKEKIAEVYSRYEQSKVTDQGMLLDFNDIIIQAAGAIEHSPAIAEEFRAQYRTFVVDEYQDVTPLQQRLLDAWLGNRDDLTVVGDANQTIYSFTGATPDYLLDFSRKYENSVVVKLQRDYRSTKEVTDLANQVIGKAKGRVAGTRLELRGMRPSVNHEPEFDQYPDDPSEARAVASKVKQLLAQGIPASEIAVLYRINALSEQFEQAFSEAGIDYEVRGGTEFFKRREIREALAALAKAAQRPELAEEPLLPTVRNLLFPLGLEQQEPTGAQARERWQSLRALADLAEEFARADATLDLQGLLLKFQQRAEAKNPPSMNRVTLTSLHSAKGLEWDAVFLTGLYESMVPIRQAIKAGEDAIEEERRLLYVGVTRARERLYCSWSLARQEGGKANRQRSRFLDGIAPTSSAAAIPGRAQRRKTCRVCGSVLVTAQSMIVGRCEDCPGDNEELFQALRTWRREVAMEIQKPAYVVFSDATLRAIAEKAPTTEVELGSVSGVGEVKLERFGREILAIVEDFA